MRVTLRVSKELLSKSGSIKVCDLGQTPFVIGRDPAADWTLEDPTNQVSGEHLKLYADDEGVILTDVSRCGTSLGKPGNRLQRGQPTRIRREETLFLPSGELTITVEESNNGLDSLEDTGGDSIFDAAGVSREVAQRSRQISESNRRSNLGDFLSTPKSQDILDDAKTADTALDHPRSKRRGQGMPDVTDVASQRQKSRSEMPQRAATWSEQGPQDLDDDSFLDDKSFDDEFAGIGSEEEFAEVSDPILMVDEGIVATEIAETLPETNSAHETAQDPKALLRQTPDQVEPTNDTVDAFLKTLGVDASVMTLQEKHDAVLGTADTFRSMAGALASMLKTRAKVKRALGIVATEIDIGHNPLKTARNADAAVEGLLRPLSSGYLFGPQAVEDAKVSMEAHQLALASGIKMSMEATIRTFDPESLEEELQDGPISRMIPKYRKAALWDAFCSSYAKFQSRVKLNMRAIIGQELDQAYQKTRETLSVGEKSGHGGSET